MFLVSLHRFPSGSSLVLLVDSYGPLLASVLSAPVVASFLPQVGFVFRYPAEFYPLWTNFQSSLASHMPPLSPLCSV